MKGSLHDNDEDHSVKVVNFAIPERRNFTSTNDPHSNAHKYTCTFPDGKIHNDIVHTLTDKRHSSILHVQCFGGADCDTKHYRVVAEVKETFSASTGGTYKFRMQRFFLKKLNCVEENSMGSKFPTDVQIQKTSTTAELINRAAGNTRGNFKISVQKCIGYD
jgi:hypothetical protein